jgi:aminoglycoside/choline kinase family phosphotransferase
MKDQTKRDLATLFEYWSNEQAVSVVELPPSGSYRKYFRITGPTTTAIGVFNPDHKENIAFVELTKHFHRKGLSVPALYTEALEHHIYLIQDLGDTTLFAYLTQVRQAGNFPPELLELYKCVIEQLPRFQIVAGQDLNYEVCYPRARFDKQSMLWDLNYFKYYFLKLAKIPFDEQLLEDDFHRFTEYLLQTECNFFLYRDFQSRNILLHRDEPYFIDYQGGRRGALQYDLASLLYDAKADLPLQIRTELLDYYVNVVSKLISINAQEFLQYFYGYVLIRMMQAMGAYGFRGFYERKPHFLESIPYAIKNLRWILEHVTLPVEIPALTRALHQIVEFPSWEGVGAGLPKNTLQVRINSFSYKRGIPADESGHGGGYVFDCRALPNPGRYEQYAHLTGKDKAVSEFLERAPNVQDFLKHVYFLVDQSIEDYQQRHRLHLMVNFGCTGGRHRSVYCAEMLAKHLRAKYNVEVVLRHLEQGEERKL